MEKILIDWLESYTKAQKIAPETKFVDLRFDLFDQAMTIAFIRQQFNKKINPDIWFDTVGELIDSIS